MMSMIFYTTRSVSASLVTLAKDATREKVSEVCDRQKYDSQIRNVDRFEFIITCGIQYVSVFVWLEKVEQ